MMRNQTVRYLTVLTDLILINLAFALAYVARYQWEWLLPVTFPEPYSDYRGQQLVLTLLLVGQKNLIEEIMWQWVNPENQRCCVGRTDSTSRRQVNKNLPVSG